MHDKRQREIPLSGVTVPSVGLVEARLRAHGTPRHHNKQDPLDELVFILLSAQTEEYAYLKTYEVLRQQHPGWRGLAEASEAAIADVIRPGGLHRKKAHQLKAALNQIVADVGRPDLTFLHARDDAAVYRYLVSLPGIARKTALCIMMYSLGRRVFPVDTHVWRIARRLGWAPAVPKPTGRYERELEDRIPLDLRYSLHVNMVAHGRGTCVTYWPKCDSCVLADICPSRYAGDEVWSTWRKPRGVWSRAVGGSPSRRSHPTSSRAPRAWCSTPVPSDECSGSGKNGG